MRLHLLLILFLVGSVLAHARIRRDADQNALDSATNKVSPKTDVSSGKYDFGDSGIFSMISTIIQFTVRIFLEPILAPIKILVEPFKLVFKIMKWVTQLLCTILIC